MARGRRKGPPPKRHGPREDRDLLYGVNSVLEALRAGKRKFAWAELSRRSDHPRSSELRSALDAAGVQTKEVGRDDLQRHVPHGETQGVVLCASRFEYTAFEELVKPKEGGHRRLVLLDRVQDPQNLGAIVRTAEAAGFDGALISSRGAASVTPAAVRASAGACEHLPIAKIGNESDTLSQLKDAGFWAAGLAADGADIYDTSFDMDLVLVVGTEGKGIRPGVRNACDLIVSLPMRGQVSSLNASAAAAAAIYQIIRVNPS